MECGGFKGIEREEICSSGDIKRVWIKGVTVMEKKIIEVKCLALSPVSWQHFFVAYYLG